MNINQDFIQERLNRREERGYYGLEMSGNPEEGKEGMEISRHENFNLIKGKFPDLFWDLDWKFFYLQSWKGSVWWGSPLVNALSSDEKPLKEFNGWSSASIIEWLYKNKPYPKKEIKRIITKQKRYEVLKRQKWRCNECGEVLKFSKNSNWEGKIAHIDHIHPFSKKESYKGGKPWLINENENLQALCPDCNKTKSGNKLQ